jgi:transposase-like protein
MPMTVWRRHCNRYAFLAFRSFEQPQAFIAQGQAALKLLRKLLKRQGFAPTVIVTDKLRSYGAGANNRAENSHQQVRRRERKMQGFKSVGSAQRFVSVHAAAVEGGPRK